MEEEFEASGGEWREYRIGDLFGNIVQGSRLTKADQIDGLLPFVMAGVTNTGVVRHIGNKMTIFPKNSLTIDIFGNVFYRNYEFSASDDVGVYWNDEEYSEHSMLFLASSIQKSLVGKFDFGNKLRSSKSHDLLVKLPTLNNKLAFSYMESYIKALESERIETLESYLTVTNLRDYHLTKNDEKVLDKFAKLSDTKSRVEESEDYAYFKLQDVLKWCSGIKELSPLKLDELSDESENKYPFYGQAIINNGIISYHNLRRDVLNNPDGRPTILIHSNNQNIVYLESPFYLKDGHGATSVLQSEKLDKYTAFYLMTAIKKVIEKRFNYNAKATKIGLKETEIQLPIQNGQIDYTFMSDFIRAVEKLVIKDLVIWADKKIAATKEVVAR